MRPSISAVPPRTDWTPSPAGDLRDPHNEAPADAFQLWFKAEELKGISWTRPFPSEAVDIGAVRACGARDGLGQLAPQQLQLRRGRGLDGVLGAVARRAETTKGAVAVRWRAPAEIGVEPPKDASERGMFECTSFTRST